MSLYKRSKVIRSPKYLEKRKKRRTALLIVLPIALISVLSTLFLLSRASFLSINNIDVIGYANVDQIKTSVTKDISGFYLKIIPKSNTFLASKSDIASSTMSKFSDIESIEISRRGFSTLILNIKSKSGIAMLCDGFPQDTDNKCYFIDKDGIVFKEVGKDENMNLNKYYTSSVSDSGMLGKKFIDPEKLNQFDNLLKSVSNIGLLPLGLLLNDDGQYELYVREQGVKNASSSPTTIYLDDKSPLSKTLSNFLLFWKNYKNTSKGNEQFDYIDMRFGNTVFYATK